MKIRVQPGAPAATERRAGSLPVPGGWLEAGGASAYEGVAWSPGRRCAVGLCGRLRNAASLQAELEARGAIGPGASPAELAAVVAGEVGPDRLSGRLEGELALIVWDGEAGRLWAARDAAGAWRVRHRVVDGAIEVEAGEIGGGAPDPAGLAALVGLGALPPGVGLWRGWEQLPAGGWAAWRADLATERGRWWGAPVGEPGFGGAGHRWARSVGFAVDLAARQAAEGATAALLSGGLGARAVLERAARRGRKDRLVAIYVDLGSGLGGDLRDDPGSAAWAADRAAARAQARAAGVELREVACGPEEAWAALRAMAALPVPAVAPELIPAAVALRAAAGIGVDRAVAGIGVEAHAQDRGHVLAGLPGSAAWGRAAMGLAGWGGAGRWICRWRGAGLPGLPGAAWAAVDGLAEEAGRADPAGLCLWVERRLYAAEAWWPGFAGLARAEGLEGALPLIDPRVLQVSGQAPIGQLRWGRRGLLGRAVGGELPERRPVRAPVAAWLRGPLAGRLAGLPDRVAGRVEGLRADQVARWAAELAAGQDRGRALWGLLTVAEWLERQG